MAKMKNMIIAIGLDQKALRKMNKQLRDTKRNFSRDFGAIADSVKNAGQSMTNAITLPLAAIGVGAMKAAVDMERLEVSFISLTGGASQAAAAVDMLNEFTAKTPFQIEGVAKAARQLIASGTGVGEVSSRLQFLGDIAATSGAEIEDIAAIFSKVNAKGKVELENLNQLAERGIPIFKALSDSTGLLPSELGAGAVTVKQFNEVLKSFSEEGGFAHGAMERLSETASGRFSTALDNLKIAGAELMESLMPALKGVLDKVIELSQSVSRLTDDQKKWIIGISAAAAAIGPMLVGVSMMMPAVVSLSSGISKLTALTWSWNAALAANPIGVVVAAVAVFIGGMISLGSKIKRAINYQKDLNQEQREWTRAVDESNQKLREQHELLTETATAQQILSDLTVDNVKSALGRIDGLVAGFDAYNKLMLPQSTLDRVVELEEHFKNVETFGVSPLAMAIAQVRDEMEAVNSGGGLGMTLKEYRAMNKVIHRRMELERMIAENQADVFDDEPISVFARNLKELPMVFEDVGEAQEEMWDASDEALAANGQKLMAQGEAYKGFAQSLSGSIQGIFSKLAAGTQSFGQIMGDMLQQLLIKLAAMAAAFLIISILTGGAGGAAMNFGDFMKAGMGIPKLASGGLASSPTLAVVGDNRNAMADPEVIAPLSKLQGMMGGQGGGHLTGRISGRDIVLASHRDQRGARRTFTAGLT